MIFYINLDLFELCCTKNINNNNLQSILAIKKINTINLHPKYRLNIIRTFILIYIKIKYNKNFHPNIYKN